METTSNLNIYIIGFICLLLVALLALLLLLMKTKKSSQEEIKKKKKVSSFNYLLFLYEFFRDTSFLSKYLSKIKGKVQILYPSDDNFTIIQITSKILLKGVICAVGGIVLTLLIGQGDIFFICSGILITYIVINVVINGTFEKQEDVILEQFADFLSSVRHKYHDMKIVDSAIAATIDELPYEISLHIQTIYDIIISPNMKQKIDQYVVTAPNKYILMFLSICSSINEYGDKTLEDGTSLFLTDLNYLKEEVNMERIARKKNRNAFSCLTGIALAPVLAIKPFEAWAVSNMPEIGQYYEGLYGIIGMITIFVSSFVCYSLIVALKEKEREVEKETDIFARIAGINAISTYLSKIIAKHYRKYEEYDNDLQSLGNHTGPKAFLLKRIVLMVGCIVLSIVILSASVVTQKISYVVSWSTTFDNVVVQNEDYTEIIRDVAKAYANTYISTYEPVNEEEIAKEIAEKEGIKTVYAQTIAQELVKRNELYKNTYFRWWYLIASFGIGLIAYASPVLMLRFKKNIINMRKQEEVVQFQSLMLILMHMDGITVSEILEWLERFSYCFKEDIADCRVKLFHGEREALIELRDSQRYELFRDFVENLLSIDKVGVTAAFDEIRTDREFYKEDRKEQNERNIEVKSAYARMISFIPMGCTIALYLIVPIILYAASMFEEIRRITG